MAIFPAASNLVPIHRLYHPLLSLSPSLAISSQLRPRPTSAVEHRPPFPFARRGGAPARGNGARRRRRAGGVAPTSSANRPTDRPDRAFSSQPGQYQAGSRREGCSTFRSRRSCYALPIPVHNASNATNDARPRHLARGCHRRGQSCARWALAAHQLTGRTRKMGRTPSHESRIDREINVRRMDVE